MLDYMSLLHSTVNLSDSDLVLTFLSAVQLLLRAHPLYHYPSLCIYLGLS